MFMHSCSFASLSVFCLAAISASGQLPKGPGYHLESTWKIGGAGGWDYLNVDHDAHRLYLTRGDRVEVIDTDKGVVIGDISGLDGGHGVALAPEADRGFATSGKTGTVLVFDLATLKAVGVPIAVGKKPDAIIYDPASKHVFAFNGDSGDASVIDPAKAAVVATIPLGGAPEFAAADGKGTLYVNLEDKSETVTVDTTKNTITHRASVAPGESPSGLALDAGKGRLFAGCHNEQVSVVDAAAGKVVASPKIGKGVDACAFDPETGYAFASCSDGTLTVIEENSDQPGDYRVAQTVTTQKGARTMALDPKSHAVYLAAADFEPEVPTAPGEHRKRPNMLPGSFVILKFVR